MCGAEVVERHAAAWRVLDGVPDPEVPVLSVRDLGIVREVRDDAAVPGGLEVVLTPTYSGCPATEVIADSVREAVEAAGLTYEPALWVADARGRVVARLDAVFDSDEIADAFASAGVS